MSEHPKRREFIGTIAASAVALSIGGISRRASALASATDVKPSDDWIPRITGKHRQFFDMPGHGNGMGLLHVRNYLNTLRDTYHVTPPGVTAVVSLYGGTTLLAFNDAMWQKYSLGQMTNAMDANKAPATSNVFYKAPAGSATMNLSGAPIALPSDVSIAELQSRGGLFLLCNNAFNLYMGFVSKGVNTPAVRDEFLANLLPGVHLVPAMVVACNQAQMHGCTYMNV
jgi:hypothetical protein